MLFTNETNGHFFDILLPEKYLRNPPKVHYHSYLPNDVTMQLNPKLYATGNVCLSVLGTWDGPGWDPKNSTVLQVLISIQGMVLVEEP